MPGVNDRIMPFKVIFMVARGKSNFFVFDIGLLADRIIHIENVNGREI